MSARHVLGILAAALLVATVVAANYLTTRYHFIPVGFGLEATAGTLAAGLALGMRDLVHDLLGRWAVLGIIAIGAGLSYLVADPFIALASGVAFLVAELVDFAVYVPLRRRAAIGDRRWAVAVAGSNVAGAVVDTLAFLSLAFGWVAVTWSARAFAVAPDVVGDAAATWGRSAPWLPKIRALGYPAALVAQNGIEDMDVPWDAFDVLFIGGDTAWKLGPHARRLVAEAKVRGKHVHMGRVNSERRLRYAAAIGCDSVDGTYIAFGPDLNLPDVLAWLRGVQTQTVIEVAQ